MEGLARASGAGIFVTLGGREFILAGAGLGDRGIIEQTLLSRRKKPLDRIREINEAFKEMDPVLRDSDLVKAEFEDQMRDALASMKTAPVVSEEEERAYLSQFEGTCQFVWLQIRKNHPDITLEWTVEQLQKLSIAEQTDIMDKIQQASGVDDAGNLTGSSETGVTPTIPDETAVAA